jgi:diaminopimelate epimerase
MYNMDFFKLSGNGNDFINVATAIRQSAERVKAGDILF